jgi:hypothetical protein
MRQQGIPMDETLLAAVRARDAQEARDTRLEIWPDMAAGVLVFLALTTQWKRGTLGEVVGLDYAAIHPTAKLLNMDLDQQAFHDIREMEGEALRAIRSKRRG